MLTGKGVSLILKTIQVKYKRPVTYPDTVRLPYLDFRAAPLHHLFKLLIGQKPYPISGSTTHFGLLSAAYSYAQRAVVAECDCTLVWYDYEKLKKCIPGERESKILWEGRKAVEHVI
jgi:Thioesterase-like superfamily